MLGACFGFDLLWKWQINSRGFFQWHDEPANNRVKNLLNELKYKKIDFVSIKQAVKGTEKIMYQAV